MVQAPDTVYTVADLSRVWVSAEVAEQQTFWANLGNEASAYVAAVPDQQLTGRLAYVAKMVNPETRTVTVQMEVHNPERLIKPKMLAALLIHKQEEEACRAR